MNTSASSIRRSSAFLAVWLRRSNAADSLLRLYVFQNSCSPPSSHSRKGSPLSGSILITSAPKSPSCSESMFPATSRERSSTLIPVSGPFASGVKRIGAGFAESVADSSDSELTSRASSELADLGLEQIPGTLADMLLPTRIKARQRRPERCLVGIVEDHALARQIAPQLDVQRVVVCPLQSNEFSRVGLDDALHIGRQTLPHLHARQHVVAGP